MKWESETAKETLGAGGQSVDTSLTEGHQF